ncbi:exp1-like protein [Dissophora globulifera]|nr:exp1-like protein [Dissophora globulifera]
MKLPALDFPKRPSTPWNLFYMEHLAKVKAAGKQIVPTAETAAASLIWKELSPSQKQVYDETYRANFENYKKLISARLQELTPAEFKLENTRRQALRAAGKRSLPALKDPNAPKRPLSSFFSFAKDQRDAGKFSDLAQKDQARAFAKAWKELSEEQRRRYEEQTRAALEVFKQDKARYESGV